jgi:hypothetical protein
MNTRLLIFSTIMTGVLAGCTQSTEFATINVGDKEGLINNKSGIVVKPIFKRVSSLQGIEGNYQHPNYLNIHWFHNNTEKRYAVVENTKGKLGIINTEGELVAKPIYDSISSRFNGFIKVEVGNKFGLLNEDFEVVLKPIFDDVEEFIYDTAIIKHKGKYGCIDRNMKMKIQPTYDQIYLLNENTRRIELDGKWGFMDGMWNVVVKPSFDYIEDFSNGIAKFKNNGHWGYVKPDGTLLSKNIFKQEDSF